MIGPDALERRYIDDGDRAKALLLILNRQKS
jgi:hypothetical protein